MLSAGSVVAGYYIKRVLGSGGMGAVYLAQNPELPRMDALKVMSDRLSRDPGYRARFMREADVAAQLDHPNIVRIYSRGETDDGQLWIAMQFVDGSDAEADLSARNMTPARAVHIVREIGKALDYAHRRHIVHRDVKPANVLLSRDVEERVLLGDFGIARALTNVAATATGSTVETVAYAAPEVLAGQPCDGRADLYSLGCMLFRMLTGRTPFPEANGPGAVIMAHLHQPPPRVTDAAPSLPLALNTVLLTALAKDPAQRFQSGAQLAEAVASALTVPAPMPTPDWHDLRAPRALAAPPAPPTLIPPQPTAFPPLRPRRHRRWVIAAALAATIAVTAAIAVAVEIGGSTPTNRAEPLTTSTTVATATESPSPPAPIMPPQALAGLLLPLDDIRAIMGDQSMTQKDQNNGPFDASQDLISNKNCASAYAPIQSTVLSGTGYLGLQYQLLTSSDSGQTNFATQAVIAFPTAKAAQQFLVDQTRQWQQCANRRVALNFPKPADHENFGPVVTTPDGVLTITGTRDVGVQQHGQHALAVRNNVVIESRTYSTTPGDQALAIVSKIDAKIPAQ